MVKRQKSLQNELVLVKMLSKDAEKSIKMKPVTTIPRKGSKAIIDTWLEKDILIL